MSKDMAGVCVHIACLWLYYGNLFLLIAKQEPTRSHCTFYLFFECRGGIIVTESGRVGEEIGILAGGGGVGGV